MENQEFRNIIFRYFKGQLAENEYLKLTNFIQDKNNRGYYNEAKIEWEGHPELDETGIRNLNNLRKNIKQNEDRSARLKNFRRFWLQTTSIAAILIVGFFAGSTITHLISKNDILSEQLVFQTPRGEKSKVELPDGSEVWLNANSRLVYNSFSPTHRQVELQGEAFFKIAQNENAPFVVKTNQCEIEVLGTTFNVMAYDEFGRKEITLLNGKVNIRMENSEQILKPGQALILKDHQFEVVESGVTEASAWVENKFNFRNIPFSELIKRLENWYDVDITVDNKAGKEVNFSGTFKNEETIWQVLDAIKVYTPIKFKKTDLRQIVITVG